jgi:integrase
LQGADGITLTTETGEAAIHKAAMSMYETWMGQHQGGPPGDAAARGLLPARALPRTAKSVASLVEAYYQAKKSSWSSLSIAQYQRWNVDLCNFFGDEDVNAVEIVRAEQYKEHLLGQGYSANTIIHRLESASSIWNWGEKVGWLKSNPWRGVTKLRRVLVRGTDPFTPDEVRRILNAAQEKFVWFYPCLLVLAVTGCRREAARLLDVRDWDPSSRTLRFRPEISKQGRGHLIRLPDDVAAILNNIVSQRAGQAPLFTQQNGSRLGKKALDAYAGKNQSPQLFRRVLDAAGVRPRGVHQLRSAVDSNLVMAGVPLDTAVRVTGHSGSISRDHYLRVDTASQEASVRTLVETYGVSQGVRTTPARHLPINEKEARLLLQSLTSLEEKVYQNSGTIF